MSQENLSNEQLALLDSLMYIDQVKDKDGKTVVSGISNSDNKGKTLGKYLNSIDIDKLPAATNDTNGNISGEITSYTKEDWQNLINAAKNDEQLSNLKIKSTLPDPNGKHASGACFVDDNGNATVAFRGTGQYEWLDNGKMAYSADTEQQELAKDWVNSLGYDDITVIGHSKGGNKAEYVTIATDKIARCVAFDAPGFGEEFCDKYKDEIANKKDRITLIAPQDGYVCDLFFNIAGITKYYKTNGGTTSDKVEDALDIVGKNLNGFSKDTIFSLIGIGISGEPTLLKIIDEYNIVTGNASEYWSDAEPFLKNIGVIAGRAHMANSFFTIQGGNAVFNEETVQDPAMALIHDYINFMVKNVSKEDRKCLTKFLMGQFQGGKEMVNGEVKDIDFGELKPEFVLRMANLTYLWVETLGIPEDDKKKFKDELSKFLKGKESAAEFSVILSKVANESHKTMLPSLKNDIRDFTNVSRENLINLIKDVEGDNPLEYNKWPQWDAVDDFTRRLLHIDYQHNQINKYYEYLIEKNNSSIDKINIIFDKAYEIDNEYSAMLMEQDDEIKQFEVRIEKLIQRFDTSLINVDVSSVKIK